jgi:Flp pilus assembly pilin Flp
MFSLFEIIDMVKAIRKDGRGVTALEYGLIAGCIAVLPLRRIFLM